MTVHSTLRGCGCSWASVTCKPWDRPYFCGLAPEEAMRIAEMSHKAKQDENP